MTNEAFYIRVVGYKNPRHFGPYSSSEWDPKTTLREFQSGLVPGYRAELLDKLPDLAALTKISKNLGGKKKRKFPTPSWDRKKPLVEFNQGNSRWVLEDGSYVLLNKVKWTWEPSLYIFPEAANELTKIALNEI